MSIYEGVIDVYDENKLDLQVAFDQGIRLILHQTSRGLYRIDGAYAQRKNAALEMGFLWGAYHLLSAEDTAAQLERFLSIEDGSDARIGLAIDREPSARGTMSYPELRRFVALFNERMKPRYSDRYPILYGASLLRETQGIVAGDSLLAKCPLWYARYTKDHPLEIPSKTWATYTLWQFADEHRQFGGPAPHILPGADFSRYQGALHDLRRAWPFAAAAAVASAESSLPADTRSFADQAMAIATQEWTFFGEQTFDLADNVIHVGHKEGDEGFFQRVGTYWADGANKRGIDGRNHEQPWSAAFICFVMKKAGAGDRFRYSPQHSQYISRAIRDFLRRNPEAGYWGCRLTEAKPKVGDIVRWARQPGIDCDHQNGGDYPGHCDLVVAVNDRQVDIVGGNVGNSVTRRPLRLSGNGFLQETVRGTETLFAIMQNRIANPATGVPIA